MENDTTQNNTELKIQNDTEEILREKPKKKYDFYVELVLFLILGILIGIALKTEAVKKITIGYDDYKMKIMKSDFDINKIEKDILQKQNDEAQKGTEENQIDNNTGNIK
ncbi:MAG: hypothetical protein Q7U36_04595 [bacterium]|nr:hypothetical protein [bacterium]